MRKVNSSVAAVSAVALWGLAFPLIQEGLDSFSPVVLGFLRFGTASLFMGAILVKRFSISEMTALLRKEWRPLLVFGMLYVTIPNIAQNVALVNGTSSMACVIQSSGPVMTLVFAMALLGERLTRGKAIGTTVAMIGTVVLVTGDGISLSNEGFVSNVVILVSAVSYGLAWVSAKRVLERNDPMLVIGLAIVIGTLLLGASVPLDADIRFEPTTVSVLNIAILGVFCAGVSSILYLTALREEEVSRLAFFIYLMPVFASLFAWLLRGEMVEAVTVVCAVVIVLGISVATRERTSNGPAGPADDGPGTE